MTRAKGTGNETRFIRSYLLYDTTPGHGSIVANANRERTWRVLLASINARGFRTSFVSVGGGWRINACTVAKSPSTFRSISSGIVPKSGGALNRRRRRRRSVRAKGFRNNMESVVYTRTVAVERVYRTACLFCFRFCHGRPSQNWKIT